jgi:hypothetical protein
MVGVIGCFVSERPSSKCSERDFRFLKSAASVERTSAG